MVLNIPGKNICLVEKYENPLPGGAPKNDFCCKKVMSNPNEILRVFGGPKMPPTWLCESTRDNFTGSEKFTSAFEVFLP